MPEIPITTETLELMLSVTKIAAGPMRQALHGHLVQGLTQTESAARHGVHKQQLGQHVKRIRTEIKPAFDAYATHMLRQQGQ